MKIDVVWQHEIEVYVMKNGALSDCYKVWWEHEIKPEHKAHVQVINAHPVGTPIPGVGFRLQGAWHRHFKYGVFL